MLPCVSQNNGIDRFPVNSKSLGYFSIRNFFRLFDSPYFKNLMRPKLGFSACVALWYSFGMKPCSASIAPWNHIRLQSCPVIITHWLSAFFDFITFVFSGRSKKQMTRINANWVVALVAHMKPVWNLSEMNNPRCAVRSVLGYSIFEVSKLAVVCASNFQSNPLPTLTNFLNMLRNLAVFINPFPEQGFVGFDCLHNHEKPTALKKVLSARDVPQFLRGGKLSDVFTRFYRPQQGRIDLYLWRGLSQPANLI
jgi:hypothetical protein